MAAESETGEERTEDPTGRRLNETRREGQVAKSLELSQVFGMIAAFTALRYICPLVWEDLITLTKASFTSHFSYEPFTVTEMRLNFYYLIRMFLPEILAIMAITALIGSFATAIQTKFLFSLHLLKPKFSQLNPMQGMKRIFSSQNAVNTLKQIAKLSIICPVAYFTFLELFPGFLQMIDIPVADLLPLTAIASLYVFKKIMYLLIVLAIADYFWQLYQYRSQVKMTKTETKEERKTVEGDEATKRKILAIGFKRIREQMMKALPTADVVVTNPTHYAVALKYDLELGGAPRVIAKGKDHLAQLIKKRAKDFGIPVIERKPLARALFATAEVGQEIPYELYKAVAELLAYVYKIRRHNPFKGRPQKKIQKG